ncbi:MAG: bifunctional dihydroorotate dehydrogenase B NAD binding subunit/NADPH-dependent glutamate synthase [Bacteroidaceae bacterium]|nr:bifunctional dihydroorotate dehydrogenase B NAD binding subunit/NADPH-dependent glutamate synthase [Bacteroidaceae bacterium]
MYRITYKEQYSENVFRLDVEAPLIARSRKAGNFVIVRVDEGGERIPLTISDSCREQGTIMLVVQRVGVSTRKLCDLNVGDEVADVVGPLGQATKIENFGTVVCAGGGVGVAPMLPIIKALKEKGNRVISVLAGRSKELIILEDMVRQSSDEVIIMTDDGSYGQKGLVTQGIEQVILREKVDKCFAIGPAVMMKFCCLLTKKYNIPTEVSLNTIMVDGTGMCGACRVTVGGRTRFVCVDGPEFDGHEVDFDEMMMRMKAYRSEEQSPAPTLQVSSVSTPGERTPSPDGAPSGVKSEMETLQSKAEERPSLSAKERMAIPRVVMPELEPKYRATKLREEVNKGLTLEMAQREAQRCLACKNPGCVKGCPVGIDIPSFIKHIEHGEVAEAAAVLKRYSALPAVCGRVCPQEKQCEAQCIHHKMKSQPVAIGYLERFAADWSHEANPISVERTQAPDATGARTPIAVIGSGPAGLSFAGEMAARGYEVTVFEALHEIGGVLKYGIPEYRLPNSIVDREIESLREKGVKFVTDCVIGKTITVDELREQGFKGVFVASGAGLPNFMNIPGENLINVLSSNEYLTRVNLMDASNEATDTPVPRGKRVAVIGGGNTAMDSVRTALRLGAERAMIVYRRSEAEMPARAEEVKHAKEEGVEFLTLHNPLEYLGDDEGKVQKIVLQKMELGEPDQSGRRSPVPIEGATEVLDVDLVIVAVGVSPNPIVPRSVEGLELGRKNTIAVNEQMESNVPMLFAGGDIVRGGATVILAMGDGKRAAKEMDEKLRRDTGN